ncbi:Na+/H+ antiporter subunit E [candidate division KSB1 bacterium]|nr:Na+/H+ antiporter subunit E [candidate division KSB1 bacterium]
MKQVVLSGILAIVWCLFHNSFDINTFSLGFILALIIIFLLRRSYFEQHFMVRLLLVVKLILKFLVEVLKANIAVLKLIYRPKLDLEPGIIDYPLRVKTDFQIVLLANMITLTPGTLSIDISPDKKHLYIHCLHIDEIEQSKQDIQNNLENPILAISGQTSKKESVHA